MLGILILAVVLSLVIVGVQQQNRNNSLESQLNAKDSSINLLNQTVNSLNAKVNSLNGEVTGLQKQVGQENSTNSALESQLSLQDTTIDTETDDASNLQGQVLSGESQAEELQSQITQQQSTIATLSTKLANVDSTMANWDSPVSNGFSLIQITDTQFLSESYPDLFNTLTSWIVNNSNALNVSMVIHTGDIVNTPTNVTDWQAANNAMMQLYDNGIPYTWDAGNHDIVGESIPSGNPDGVWIGGEYEAFNVTVMQQEPYWVASIFNGSSTAVQFTYGNYKFMVINVAYDANATVLNWMQTLIKCNPNDNIIVATHNFLTGIGTYGYTPSLADQNWAENFEDIINGYPNIIMTLNGHDINEGQAFNVKIGNREEIFFNRQQADNLQGGACARIYTFNMTDPANPTISVYTYQLYASNSTATPQYLTDPLDQFNFTENLTPYSSSTINLESGTPFMGSSGYKVTFADPIALAAYNQTGDTLRFTDLTLNDATSNLTVTSVGANIKITQYDNGTLTYTVDGGGGTQTFLFNAMPTSVQIDSSDAQMGNGWTYANGQLVVTGASSSVTVTLT